MQHGGRVLHCNIHKMHYVIRVNYKKGNTKSSGTRLYTKKVRHANIRKTSNSLSNCSEYWDNVLNHRPNQA